MADVGNCPQKTTLTVPILGLEQASISLVFILAQSANSASEILPYCKRNYPISVFDCD